MEGPLGPDRPVVSRAPGAGPGLRPGCWFPVMLGTSFKDPSQEAAKLMTRFCPTPQNP